MDYDDIMEEEGGVAIDTNLLANELDSIDSTLPPKLYIVPIRYRPIFPGIVTPFIISQGRFSDTVEKVINSSRTLGLVLVRDEDKEEIGADDIYSFGTAVKIMKKINLPGGGVNVLVNSVKRFRIKKILSEKKYIAADIEYIEDQQSEEDALEIKALVREILSGMKKIADNNPMFTEETRLTMLNVDEPGRIADFVTSILSFVDRAAYQEVLETADVKIRLEKSLRLLNKEMEVLSVQKKIHSQINEKVDKQQKEFFLREQLKVIKQELGIDDEVSADIKAMKKKAEKLELKGEVREQFDSEMEKLTMMEPASSEYTITRNYLDTVLSLPWNVRTVDKIDLKRAERILEKDHYGLTEVKKRILEFLAVRTLKPDAKGAIICLVGPPGTGKTSMGRSIAKAMNRRFFRLSLGGMRDEAEIKGHRRTYIGSMPGKIIQGLKTVKSSNPVFMLDEIDKLGQSFQGDPASALLEVLDPEQNSEFRDYYLEVPFDLSDILFVTTANTLDTIPQVLADRMEIIRLSGYISEEKCAIARKYLLPRQISLHGLKAGSVRIDKSGFMYIIDGWAREAGVRNLERQIEKICRKSATEAASGKALPSENLTSGQIKKFLGQELYSDEELVSVNRPGLAMGLAWTSLGGVMLAIESIALEEKKNPGLRLTGQLGEVMTESANIAYSHVRFLLEKDPAASVFFTEKLIHLHVPAGATPKDGPSAGITMALSLYSLITGKTVRPLLAMTGELSLTGQVLPIGGVKEKLIAARRGKMKDVMIPEGNRKDITEEDAYLYKGMEIHFVKDFQSVLNVAFPESAKKKNSAVR